MKRLMKKAVSDSLLIPRPTPETVDIVAIVVMHQIPRTYIYTSNILLIIRCIFFRI